MKREGWKTWEELANAPIPVSLINEPIEPEPAKESALARSRRIWRMEEPKQ